jgi:hypothetical protein
MSIDIFYKFLELAGEIKRALCKSVIACQTKLRGGRLLDITPSNLLDEGE